MDEKQLLEKLLVAQVLTLATQLRIEQATKNKRSTSDQVSDAINMISSQKRQILEQLLP